MRIEIKIIAALAALCMIGLLGHLDAQEEDVQLTAHCELVELWNRDAANGVAVSERIGRPDYNGSCK